MTWYLVNIGITTMLWLFLSNEKIYTVRLLKRDAIISKSSIYCFVSTVFWILLSGLRGLSVGADTYDYKVYGFDKVKSYSWSYIFDRFVDRYIEGDGSIKDPAYNLITKIFQIFSGNYQLFLFFIAIIFFIPFGEFVYKNSKSPILSFVLFSTLFYGFFAITGHRQTIVTAIVVFGGYALIKKKKWLAYIIIVLLASTIHLSAICVLPFYWLSRLKINKFTLLCYWIATVCAFAFRNQLLNALKTLVDNEYYNEYVQTDGASAGIFMFLLITIGVVVTLFYKNILNYSPENGHLLINALMIAVFFSSLLLINESMMRIVQYYSLYLVLLLPELECIFKMPKDRFIYRAIVCGLLIGLFIRTNPQYVFFWQ